MIEYEIINGKKYKKCKEGQIRNLKTMRCVLKNGKIGLQIKTKDKRKEKIKIKRKSKSPIIIMEKGDLSSIDKKACIVKKGNNLIIDNNITLDMRFGSISRFGINYISSLLSNKNFKFSTKIQFNTKEAKKELKILQELKKLREKTNNFHYPMMLNYSICSKDNMGNLEELPEYFSKNKKAGYLMIFNELLSGDLKTFIYTIANNNTELLINAIEQMIMSLISLHSTGLSHNDTNYGNFLFKKVKEGGYIKYDINGKEFFIKNLGYEWVIWDFGETSQIYRYYDYIEDYNLLTLFLRYDNPKLLTNDFKKKFEMDQKKDHRPYGYLDKTKVILSDKINEIVEELWKLSGSDKKDILTNLMKSQITEDKFLELLKMKKLLFMDKPSNIKEIKETIKINLPKPEKSTDLLINKKNLLIQLAN